MQMCTIREILLVQYIGNVSELFKIRSGVKQGCVLVLKPFGILLLLPLLLNFGTAEYGVHLHTRTAGKLFDPYGLKT